jgi:hypothetical protein
MSLFDEIIKQEQYRSLFDNYPDDQRELILEKVKEFMEDAEKKILVPLKQASDIISATKKI